MRQLLSATCLALLLHTLPCSAATNKDAVCPPATHSKTQLLELKAAQFKVADDAERNALALALLPCLAHADPSLRDGVAFEAISNWLRGKQLSLQTRAALHQHLLAQLQTTPPPSDPGFAQPFAALVFSEVVRADRIDPQWDAATLSEALDVALAYLEGVNDLRGFDDVEGWRHGVAHGADVLLQLAVHPGTDAAMHRRMLDVLARRLRPQQTHFWIYGEANRLAMPALLIAQRKTLQSEDWSSWLQQVSAPPDAAGWAQSFGSQAALAQRHNVHSFLHILAVGGMRIKDPAFTDLVLERLATL